VGYDFGFGARAGQRMLVARALPGVMTEYSLTYCPMHRDLGQAFALVHPDGADSGWEVHSWRPAPDNLEHLIVLWSRSVDGRPTMPHDMATEAALSKHTR
jgi:hypothetical protein